MAKLLEKNGAELCAGLVTIANTLKRFMDDEAFSQAWKKATKNGVNKGMTDVLEVYVDIVPMLFGEEHLKDTMQILSVIEGKPIKELLEMNGMELIADATKAFKEQLTPFFQQLGVSVGVKQ